MVSEETQVVDEILIAERVLHAVCSVSEASRKWNKSETAIKLACESQRLDARHSGRDWIITVASLCRLWGEPKETDYDW